MFWKIIKTITFPCFLEGAHFLPLRGEELCDWGLRQKIERKCTFKDWKHEEPSVQGISLPISCAFLWGSEVCTHCVSVGQYQIGARRFQSQLCEFLLFITRVSVIKILRSPFPSYLVSNSELTSVWFFCLFFLKICSPCFCPLLFQPLQFEVH